MAHLRNCTLCGTQYDYCPRCDETQPTYLLKYCSANCKEISLVLNKYNFKHLTKDEAADELKKLDLAKLDKFNDSAKTAINGILKVEKPVPVKVEDELEVKVEEVVASEEPAESEEEAPAPKYKKSYRRK